MIIFWIFEVKFKTLLIKLFSKKLLIFIENITFSESHVFKKICKYEVLRFEILKIQPITARDLRVCSSFPRAASEPSPAHTKNTVLSFAACSRAQMPCREQFLGQSVFRSVSWSGQLLAIFNFIRTFPSKRKYLDFTRIFFFGLTLKSLKKVLLNFGIRPKVTLFAWQFVSFAFVKFTVSWVQVSVNFSPRVSKCRCQCQSLAGANGKLKIVLKSRTQSQTFHHTMLLTHNLLIN